MTYIDPAAKNSIVRALNKAMPPPTVVDHQYLADLIVVTLRGDGYGIESYVEIIAKRQAALVGDAEYHRNHKLANALNAIGAAIRAHAASAVEPPYPVEDEVIMYLAARGYRIVPAIAAPAADA